MANYVIIGASSGIGNALANDLQAKGNTVYGTYNKTVIEDDNGIHFHQLDVTEEEPNFDFLPEQIDGLVYCVGDINLRPFNRISPKNFVEDFELQTVGAVKSIQACLPALRKGQNPSVVLFSTVAVQHGFPFHASVAAAKGAVEGLVRSLAAEYANKIRFNAIAPSLTDTPLASRLLSSDSKKEANAERHPIKRIGSAKEMAAGAQFLLSENASWITGQVLPIDGGLSRLKV